jgi:hypothetical protein
MFDRNVQKNTTRSTQTLTQIFKHLDEPCEKNHDFIQFKRTTTIIKSIKKTKPTGQGS